MQTTHIEQICKDYGVSRTSFQTAAIAELLNNESTSKRKSITDIAKTLDMVLDDEQMINVVRWATWVEHATKNKLDGADVPSLLEIRRKKNGS